MKRNHSIHMSTIHTSIKKTLYENDEIRIQHLEDTTNRTLQFVYKFCKLDCKDDQFQIYKRLFEREYAYMESIHYWLKKNGYEKYAYLFPHYYPQNKNTNIPYVITDYIHTISSDNSITLESFLASKKDTISQSNQPNKILSKKQILHFFEQLNAAFVTLEKAGMIQLDLNPENIIIRDLNTFDITLIDFTHSYYRDSPIAGMPYKLMDTNVNRGANMSPARQLAETAALLFIRLFYPGNESYIQNVRFHDKDKLNNLRHAFENMQFSNIIRCLFDETFFEDEHDNNALLCHWNHWYHNNNFKEIIETNY